MTEVEREDVAELYVRVFPMIQQKCARILGDSLEARDVAQETFVRLWKARHTIREREALLGWIYRTATRLAVEQARKSSREIPEADLGQWWPSFDPSPEVLAGNRQWLAGLARRVPPADLEVAVLAYLDGLTQAQIGEVTGKSERTVRRILMRLSQQAARVASEAS